MEHISEMENIALSPTGHYPHSTPFDSPTRSLLPLPTPKKSNTALTFDDTDVVHKYGYTTSGGQTDATHTHITHDGVREGAPRPFSSAYDDEEEARQRDSKTNFSQLLGVFTNNPHSPGSPTGPPQHGFPSIHFPVVHRSSHHDDQVRGGAHRGVRDYPHLPKNEAATEREERAKLVESPSASDAEDAPEMGDISSPPTVGVPILRDSPRRPMGPR